jgi:lycopene cyclase domain-containing protein
MIPFIAINGILTGSGLEQPVVWYNNAQNMSLRLGTIPLEDFMYAFSMLFLSWMGFERISAGKPI